METRTHFIGASDVPAILGLSPWRTAYEVWLEKTGRLEDKAESAAMSAGKKLEAAVLDWAEEQLGPLKRDVTAAIPTTPILCHPDAMTQGGQPVEAKTSGITGRLYGEWGEPGTDEIPDYYVIQCLVQLEACKAEVCHVPALLGGRGFVLYRVPASSSLQQHIVEHCCQWWNKHVEGDTPPPLERLPELEVLKRVRRVPEKVIRFEDAQVVERWLEAKERLRAATVEAEEAQAAVLYALGDAVAAELPDGRLLTYFEQRRKGYYVKESTFRVLRLIKKGNDNA